MGEEKKEEKGEEEEEINSCLYAKKREKTKSYKIFD